MAEILEAEITGSPDSEEEVSVKDLLDIVVHSDGWTETLMAAILGLVHFAAEDPGVLNLVEEKCNESLSKYANLAYMLVVGLVQKRSQAAE